MSNVFLNATEYANVMLLLAKNNLVMGRMVNGQFRKEVTDQNGLSISVKRPPRFAPNDSSALSAALAAQDIVTGSVNVAVNQYAKVHLSIGDIESVKSWNQLMKNETMKSAASTLAHQIDKFLATKTLGFSTWVAGASTGSVNATSTTDPSKTIASSTQLSGAYTRLQDMGVPGDSLNGIITPLDGELIRGTLTGTNMSGINATALKRASLPVMSEINWYQTQQCPALTTGSRTATADTAQINNGTLSVNYRDVKDNYKQTLTIDTLTGSATIKAGEVITIASVFAYDWRNQVALPYLSQHTVLTDATMSSGAGTIDVTPPLIVPATSDGVDTNANTAFATVSAAAVDNAKVNFVGAASTTYRIRSAFRKNAISMVSAQLVTPFNGVSSFARDEETGIAIRYWRGSDITTGAHIHRWDCMFGATNVDPQMGTRIIGS